MAVDPARIVGDGVPFVTLVLFAGSVAGWGWRGDDACAFAGDEEMGVVIFDDSVVVEAP